MEHFEIRTLFVVKSYAEVPIICDSVYHRERKKLYFENNCNFIPLHFSWQTERVLPAGSQCNVCSKCILF